MTIRDMQRALDAQFLYGEELADLDEMFRAHYRTMQSTGSAYG